MSISSMVVDQYRGKEVTFIAQILQTAVNKDIISFAGGLPNPISFPQEALKESANRIIDTYGSSVFQYSNTEGLKALREFEADKLNKKLGLHLDAENVVITTGSQQSMDIIPKLFINPGDGIIVENPSYLGALQAFDYYRPTYYPVDLHEDGLDLEQLEEALQHDNVKFAYLIPEFQNPTGISYTNENRAEVTKLLKKYNCLVIEDDPYGELRFEGEHGIYVGLGQYEKSALLGTFSKSVTPGMRLGYIVSEDKELLRYYAAVKENSDLHTNIFAQYLIWDYMTHNDHQKHIDEIVDLYRSQANAMLQAMKKYFPEGTTFTHPDGGMFIWATLPEGMKSLDLFPKAVEKLVAFVPGDPFYVHPENVRTMRLNFTNASPEMIDEGIHRLGDLIKEEMK